MHPLDLLPRYAGIQNASSVGMSVDECAARIARLAAIARRRLEVFAARLVMAPEWEIKGLCGRALWEDATNHRLLEHRLRELRTHPSAIKKILSYQLGDVLTELLHAPGTVEVLSGLVVLGEAERAAIRRYLAETQPLVDQPSVRLLRQIDLDLAERQELLTSSLAALCSTPGAVERSQDWKAHVRNFLEYAGGIFGDEPKPAGTPTPRASEEFRLRRDFIRDERFTVTLPKAPPAEYLNDRLRLTMWVRAQEMTAAELVASLLVEWEDLPTDALADIARHCWDEVRHSFFGQSALEAEGIALSSLPNWTGFAGHTMSTPPPKRYAHLAIAIEAGLMAYPGGKRGEWEFCRDAGHPLMTTFQDFDWADEVTHVNYGRKWLIDHHFHGDREAARKLGDETMADRQAYYAQFPETSVPPAVEKAGY